MKTFDFTGLTICASDETPRKAAALFSAEIARRTGAEPVITDVPAAPCVSFALCGCENRDAFTLDLSGGILTVTAPGIRGLIYGYSYFLRKSICKNGQITLIKDISGQYAPDKSIRGHQLGYRSKTNAYDAWTLDQYRRYYLDIMMFGSNMVEHIPGHSDPGQSHNCLMMYDADELCLMASQMADDFDLDVSLWYPNDELNIEESVKIRKAFFEKCPRLNVVFPPGGDPGDFPGDEFVERTIAIARALKEVKPDAQMWPSAQKPHTEFAWGEDFIEEMNKLPGEIDGVIQGPNRAFTIDQLRRLLPMKYPIRLYPDVTHNVRCEYPVHFERDDWHYAVTAALSRESINPRPTEYRIIHRQTRPYVVGSVSYSEGVNDDVNKMVWGDMDYFPDVNLRDTLLDYARAFIWDAPAEKIADGILALERNWEGDPAENPHIENTLELFLELRREFPVLSENWRFCQLIFRAECDALVRRRRLFELGLVEEARECLLKGGSIQDALEILGTEFDDSYKQLHADIEDLAARLFALIGMQLEVERFHAEAWERGATLDTLDLPITDRAWLQNRLNFALSLDGNERGGFIQGLLNRNKVGPGEYYFSLAEHGFHVLGVRQEGEPYLDFQGDRVNTNDGSIPMSQVKLYDSYSFRCKLGGFEPGVDYKLRVSYKRSHQTVFLKKHTVTANGVEIYCGKPYGGEQDPLFDKYYLAPNTETATYILPADVFVNGCVELVICEPVAGMMMSEFWILKKD
ncbi:MAG: hypothetical protein FWF05_06960 [Oscillospiraceae bacterium]|nr:hypothetical protein [Oscillospiraceae bacterium]